MGDQAELKDTVEPPEGAPDAKPRLRAVEPVSEVAADAAAAARSAVDGVSEAAEQARRLTAAELGADVRRLRVELLVAEQVGAEAERRAREADAARLAAEQRALDAE